ncbi:hypothetical protein AB1286_20175 [Trinickia sp. NRRL B-1857]|uniref:hypothetical protein n=1 Tax=Trinickia sp. NRRL B-1857 TaxID=3162879 RepID=UPI003D27011E
MSVEGGGQSVDAGEGSDSNASELSLREEIAKNLAEIKGDSGDDKGATASASAAPSAKPGTEKTPTAGAEGANKPTPKTGADGASSTTPTSPEQKAKAPQSWSAADRAHWEKMPPEAQAIVARREEEVHRRITELGQEASFGKRMNEVVTPYMAIIRSEGGTPEGAFRDLLNTAYVLRTAGPEQKLALFRQIATQYGVDLSAAAQAAPQVDPHVQALRQELAQVKGHLVGQEQAQHQQVQVQAQQVIDAFAADPKNEFYEQVKPMMGQLLVAGQATDMQDAYEKACWAIPSVRSTLMQREQSAADAKRAAEAKAKADAKRRAGGSVSGSPGSPVATATTVDPNLSLRDQIRAAYRDAVNPS